jgi:hypothetical protein
MQEVHENNTSSHNDCKHDFLFWWIALQYSDAWGYRLTPLFLTLLGLEFGILDRAFITVTVCENKPSLFYFAEVKGQSLFGNNFKSVHPAVYVYKWRLCNTQSKQLIIYYYYY